MEDLRQTAGTVEGTLRRQLALHGISEYLQMKMLDRVQF